MMTALSIWRKAAYLRRTHPRHRWNLRRRRITPGRAIRRLLCRLVWVEAVSFRLPSILRHLPQLLVTLGCGITDSKGHLFDDKETCLYSVKTLFASLRVNACILPTPSLFHIVYKDVLSSTVLVRACAFMDPLSCEHGTRFYSTPLYSDFHWGCVFFTKEIYTFFVTGSLFFWLDPDCQILIFRFKGHDQSNVLR